MKIGLNSRNCDNCKKSVVDFTRMERKEILRYLIINFDNQVCGRIFPNQLDYSHEELIIIINEVSQKSKNTNLPFYFLTIGTLIISGCNQDNVSKNEINKVEYSQSNSVESRNISVHLTPVNVPSLDEPVPIMGDIVLVDPKVEPAKLSEVMPEFVGGIDSLTSYIKTNLQYPEYEKTRNIEGRIVVNFIVDKYGEIKDARVIKSVDSSKNFDKEALRIINSMPNWKAGTTNGEPIDVEFNLPISFELK